MRAKRGAWAALSAGEWVSCQGVFRQCLVGRPVVVVSDNYGACIARSHEAKDLGVSVMLVDLQPQGQQQAELDLFTADLDPPSTINAEPSRLMIAVDVLNQRFGRCAVTAARAAHQARNGELAGKQERRSPRYTPRIEEVTVALA
jgi:nucleotidyltransferase/DNA polymerase involved in DNA repair